MQSRATPSVVLPLPLLQPANSRYIFMVLWMVAEGSGIVPAADLLNAARRLRVTQDMDIEIERFETNKSAAVKKYNYVERPRPALAEQAALSVDVVSTLVLGLKEGQPVPDREAPLIASVVVGSLPGAGKDVVVAAVSSRPARGAAAGA